MGRRILRLLPGRGAVALAGSLGLATIATPHSAFADEPILAQFPPDKEACYGRIYDAGHLASHPRQAVQEIYLARFLKPDAQLEERPLSQEEAAAAAAEWEASSRKNDVEVNRAAPTIAGTTNLAVLVQFRTSPQAFRQVVECNRGKDGRFSCGVDCDGGVINVRPDGASLIIDQDKTSAGLRVQSGCSSGDESAPEVRIDPADDGRTFRLDPLSMASCEAAQWRSRPFWALSGEPLRVKLANRDHVCFANSGRGGAAAVETIRIETLGPAQDKGEEGIVLPVKLSVGLLGGRTVAVTSECLGSDYAFDCTVGEGGFRLHRSSNDGVTVDERYFIGGEIPKLLGLPDTEKVGPFDLIEVDKQRCDAPR